MHFVPVGAIEFDAHDRIEQMLDRGTADLFQDDAVAAVEIFDFRHVVPHQQDSAAAGDVQVFGRRAIGNELGIEPLPFVDNLHN